MNVSPAGMCCPLRLVSIKEASSEKTYGTSLQKAVQGLGRVKMSFKQLQPAIPWTAWALHMREVLAVTFESTVG